MTASPIDLTGDMVAIEQHLREGQRFQAAGLFTVHEWSDHQAISYTALIVLGMDGMLRMGRCWVMEESVSASNIVDSSSLSLG